MEANWIHNTQPASVKMDDVSSDMRGTKNIGELKVGMEGQITPRLNVWGNVAQQVGDQGYSNTQGLLGLNTVLIQVTTEPLIFSGFYPEALSFG